MAKTFKDFSPSETAVLINAITKARALSNSAWNNHLTSRIN